MKKKLFTILATALAIVTLIACGGRGDDVKETTKKPQKTTKNPSLSSNFDEMGTCEAPEELDFVEVPAGKVEENDNKDIALTLNVICTSKEGNADSVALNWHTKLAHDKYEVYRSKSEKEGYELIYTGTGTTYQDLGLEINQKYYYKIAVVNGNEKVESGVRYAQTADLTNSNLEIYDNQIGSRIIYAGNGTYANGRYYQWGVSSGNGGLYVWEKASVDDKKYSSQRIVINSEMAECLKACKLEAINIIYVEHINKVVIWAHWEEGGTSYNHGYAFVATGTPGGEFTFHSCKTVLGTQVRDMSLYVDDDGTGYLIAATNRPGEGANRTLRIFKLTEDMSAAKEITATLFDNQYREAPHIVKRDGLYYLFTSQCAGWYPTAGGYAVAPSMKGPWSEVRSIGNNSTFSSQSGQIWTCGNFKLMHGNRWKKGAGSSSASVLPITIDNGYAFYDFFPYLRYSNFTGELYPVQLGKNVSQNKKVTMTTSSGRVIDCALMVDGDYRTSVTAGSSKEWPVSLLFDLGEIYDLTNIQFSWDMVKGSEAYYTYIVEVSEDGKTWDLAISRMNNGDTIVSDTYGFTTNLLDNRGRYVRVYVEKAEIQGQPGSYWYEPKLFEVKIYGYETENQTVNNANPGGEGALIFMDFQNGMRLNYIDNMGTCLYRAYLHGAAKINRESTDSDNRTILFSGKGDSFMSLPTGILDGQDKVTISMDIKSNSEGNFFTFALGTDFNKYFFFKVAKDSVRFAITQNTWSGESDAEYKVTGTEWHKYTFVIDNYTIKTYVDGELLGTTETTTKISDLGDDLMLWIGKSFYLADAYFTGSIDNLQIYTSALSDADVKGLK